MKIMKIVKHMKENQWKNKGNEWKTMKMWGKCKETYKKQGNSMKKLEQVKKMKGKPLQSEIQKNPQTKKE